MPSQEESKDSKLSSEKQEARPKIPPKNFKKNTIPINSGAKLDGVPPPQRPPPKIATFGEFLTAVYTIKNWGFRPFAILSQDPVNDKWFYIDSLHQVQGGFTVDEMDAWYNLNYLPNELNIACNVTTSFKPLTSYLDTAARVAYDLYFGNNTQVEIPPPRPPGL